MTAAPRRYLIVLPKPKAFRDYTKLYQRGGLHHHHHHHHHPYHYADPRIFVSASSEIF
jgi:hypothetical protein